MLGRAELGLPLDEPLRAANLYLKLNADDVREAFARSRPGSAVSAGIIRRSESGQRLAGP
jgi:hypothetical protein